MQFKTRFQREVWHVIEAINQAWTSDRAGDIAEFLHHDCVMVAPDFDQYLRGRDAVVNSYVEFTRQATTHDFKVHNASVDIFRDTAMVNCAFAVTYSLNGKTYAGTGRDIWTLIRVEGHWLGVWRSLADMYEEEIKSGR